MNKKLIAALIAACVCISVFAGCTTRKDEESSEPPSNSEPETSQINPSTATKAEAAENNAKITDADVDLVQFGTPSASEPIAVIRTTEGDIRIRLFPRQAPKTVENFMKLAEEGYFNGLTFYEVINNNLIRTGDPTGKGTGGESIFATDADPSGYFEDEFSLDLWHFRGAVSMWSEGKNKNTSQFYIVQSDHIDDALMSEMHAQNFPASVLEKYEEVGGLPAKDWRNTVFGMVADEESMAVVDKIAAMEVGGEERGKYEPVEPVLVDSVTIESGDSGVIPAVEDEPSDEEESA